MTTPNEFRLPENLFGPDANSDRESAERALKNFRYILATVNDDALRAWSDLWDQFKSGVTPAGAILPEMEQGFKPACGWTEFLETFWLLKHYLDYTHHFCQNFSPPSERA